LAQSPSIRFQQSVSQIIFIFFFCQMLADEIGVTF